MPERLVRQRRGLVDLYRITAPQRAEHAAVLLLRGSHFTPFRHDVPRVARDGRARRLREGLSCCSREDGEHRCSVVAASANSGAVESSFFCGVAVLGCGAANGCSLGARRREELYNDRQRWKRRVLCSRGRQMRAAAPHRQASVDSRVAPHSSVSRRLAERSDQKHVQGQVQNRAGPKKLASLAATSRACCAAPEQRE